MRADLFLALALDLIKAAAAPGPLPADARVGRFFRARRFLGSHDRRLLGEAVYAWLRHVPRARARLAAWAAARGQDLQSAAGGAESRLLCLAEALALARDGHFPVGFDETFEAARAPLEQAAAAQPGDQAPGPLARLLLRDLPGSDWSGAAAWPADAAARLAAEISLPPWLAECLVAERGEQAARRLGGSLLAPAGVDLRVNSGLASREATRRSLEEELGIEVQNTRWSPLGLRLPRRRNLTGTRASRSGWIEVEDEGSQITVLALDLRPGMTVIDACAGAGGKTLAIADLLRDEAASGRAAPPEPRIDLIACDIAAEKLDELRRRAEAAGVGRRLHSVAISSSGPLPPAVPEADLVLVDAPCSGFGTLRRNPDLKLRHRPEDIPLFAGRQQAILERFAGRVKPGGRLAYATCSLLAAENEEVAAGFLAAHPEFEAAPSAWAAAHLPAECLQKEALRIDPASTGTDGFFLALWRKSGLRQGAPPAAVV